MHRPPLRGKGSELGATLSPDGRTLAYVSGVSSETITLSDVARGTQLGEPHRRTSSISNFDFSLDGRTLAVAGTAGTVELWDVASWTQLVQPFRDHSGEVGVAFSPDGRTLASAADDRRSILCTAAGVPAFSPHDLRHRRVSLPHLGGMRWARTRVHTGLVERCRFTAMF